FVGAANPFHGLNIWRGNSGPRALESPQRLETEVVGDSVVLSWEQPDGASTFRVLRDTTYSFSRDIVVSHPQAVENTWAAVDRIGGQPHFNYQVVAEDAAGRSSVPSD